MYLLIKCWSLTSLIDLLTFAKRIGEFFGTAMTLSFFSSLKFTLAIIKLLFCFTYASATGFSITNPSTLLLLTARIASGRRFNELMSAFSISCCAIFSCSVPFCAATFLLEKSFNV